MLLNEKEAIEKVLNGDNEAFSIIVDLHQKIVFNITLKMTGEKEAAMDISQETFLQAFSRLSSFDKTKKFGPWLYRIAHNKCLNYLKRKKHPSAPTPCSEKLDLINSNKKEAELTAQKLDQKELLKELNREIAQLPQKEQSAFLLKYTNNLPLKDISTILSIPVSAIKTHLFRARNKLRTKLKWWFNDE